MGSTYRSNTSMEASMVPKDDAMDRWMAVGMGSTYQNGLSLEASMNPKDDALDRWMAVGMGSVYQNSASMEASMVPKDDAMERWMALGMGNTYQTSAAMEASMLPKDDAMHRWMTLDMGSAYQTNSTMEVPMVPRDDSMVNWMTVDLKPFYTEADEMAGKASEADAAEHCMVLDLEHRGVDASGMMRNSSKEDTQDPWMTVDLKPFYVPADEMGGNSSKDEASENCILLDTETHGLDASDMVRNGLKDDNAECCMAAPLADVASSGAELNVMDLSPIGRELVVYRDPLEPRVGMQFESREQGKAWYHEYAKRAGFRIRVGRNERSKKDKECISQQFVCSKEGFRHKKYIERTDRVLPIPAHTREGCKAMLLLKKRGPNKWVVTRFEKEHNHELVDPRKAALLRTRRRTSSTPKKPLLITLDSLARQNEVIRFEHAAKIEPSVGMQFESKDAAKICYKEYATRAGFSIRVGRNERSKRDKECISWQFVCSREGFHHKRNANGKDGTSAAGRGRPTTRGGCKAMLIVKKRGIDRWVVTRFETIHNHELAIPENVPTL